MVSEILLQFDSCEPFDTEHRVQKQEEHEEAAYVGQLRYGSYESVEQDTQTFIFLNYFKDSTDSENADHVGRCPNVQSLDLRGDETKPGSNHDNEVENIPAILEVIFVKCDELYQGLNCIDYIKNEIEVCHIQLQFRWLTIVIIGEAYRVYYNTK